MREIKFRAWWKTGKTLNKNGKYSSMIYDFEDDNDCGEPENRIGYYFDHPEEYEMMQYTGLKDKLGKEIYEGDILRISSEHCEVVKWVDETCWVGTKCPVNGWVNHESVYKVKPEVIGNIYENPELLKEDKGGKEKCR